MPISPDMLSPATLPVNSRVSGIGLVIEIFQDTSSPFTVPSKISPELPSAAWVPVSVEPELATLSVALRSPIGVLMVMFQFPSTAIVVSSADLRKTGMVLEFHHGSADIAHLAGEQQRPRCIQPAPRSDVRDRLRQGVAASGHQARAARIRLVTTMRSATYCTAKAAIL